MNTCRQTPSTRALPLDVSSQSLAFGGSFCDFVRGTVTGVLECFVPVLTNWVEDGKFLYLRKRKQGVADPSTRDTLDIPWRKRPSSGRGLEA